MYKKIYLKASFLVLFALSSLFALSQPVVSKGFQANISYSGNTVSFRIKPAATVTTGFSTIEFNVRVLNTAPAFTWGTINKNLTNFPGLGTITLQTTVGPTYTVHYFSYTAQLPGTTAANYTAGTPYEVFNITTSVNPATLGLQLAHEPTETDFWLAITDLLGGDARAQSSTSVFLPDAMFFPNTTVAAGPVYFSDLTNILTPAFFQDFNVNKQGTSSAMLTWTTSQEQDVSHFIIEKSYSQTSGWTAIGEVKAKGNSNTPTKYTFTDLAAYDGSSSAKTAYYRIRAIDLDAKEKIFPIRSIRFSSLGEKEITIYPNPVKDGFNISIPVLNPQNKKIRLNLVNQAGQLLHAREIAAASASNYYYDIKTPGVIAGEYMLQIIMDGELLDTKKIIVQR